MLKSNKGYSLVEIGVGILILTIFLIVSIGLFNGAYTNYRRIKQRNIAINSAVTQIENMLQTDAKELTGFFIQELDTTSNRYVLKPNSLLVDFVKNKFTAKFKDRYTKIMGISKSSLNNSEASEYIEKDSSYAIDMYIQDKVNTDDSVTSKDLANGNYGFIIPNPANPNEYIYSKSNVIETYNGKQVPSSDSTIYVTTNEEPIKVRKTVSRLSAEEKKAYGNEVLKLKVEVFYSNKFGDDIPEKDMDCYTIETIKVSKAN